MTKHVSMEVPRSLRCFGSRLIAANGLDIAEWVLLPGMCFGAKDAWWDDGKARPHPHEGIDLALYRNRGGRVVSLDGTTKVPLAAPGEVAVRRKDFLGESLFVRHGLFDEEDRELFSLYGHTRPGPGVFPGRFLEAGAILATFADVSGRGKGLLPHLHLSVAWIPRSLPPGTLTWERCTRGNDVVLLDPVGILEGRDLVTSLRRPYDSV